MNKCTQCRRITNNPENVDFRKYCQKCPNDKIMKSTKKKNFFQRFLSPTPKEWKRVAITFGSLAASITSAYLAVKTLGINTDKFDVVVGVTIGLCTLIATYAQQKEKKI